MRGLQILCLMVIMLVVTEGSGQMLTDTVRVREVNVLAKRKVDEAGLKITRPDSMQRASFITADLSELLSDYSPVFIKSYGKGSMATASFRGAAATHTQVFWNGMNLNSPMRGLADLSLVPVYFTDGMYLLHGGSSMTKGSGALGGSIHLENTPDWSSKLSMEGMAEAGSYGARKTFFKLTLGNERLQSSTRLFYETAENNFSFYNTGVMPNKNDTLEGAGFLKGGILQEFYLRHAGNNVSGLRLWLQGSDRNLPQLMSYQGSEREEYQTDLQFRAQYDWKKYTDGLNYHFFTGLNTTRLNYYRATPTFDFVNEDSESRELGFLNHLRIFRQFDDETYVTMSLDANYYEVNALNRITDIGFEKYRLETSLMMNMHLKPSEMFAMFVLIRADFYDDDMVPLIPSAGIEWQLSRNLPLVLRANAARNFHKPTLNELYWIPGGNPDLESEDGYTGDVSLSAAFGGDKLTFSNEVTGYLSLIKNWISWQPAVSGAYYWEADNIREVFSRGIEYQYKASLRTGPVTFRSGGNYSFTRTANQNAVNSADESRGKQLIYIPKHKGGAYLSASWNRFTLKFDLNGVGRRYTTSSNRESAYEQVLNPYWLGKLSAGKQIEYRDVQMNLKLTVDNLFDQSYQSILWRPMPGRHYALSVALNFDQDRN